MRSKRNGSLAKLGVAFICSFAAVSLAVPAPAQAPSVRQAANASGPSVRFAHVSVEQGMSQSTVTAILQDHVGFMWFGTEEGLNRYDGYSFVVYRHDPDDDQSLPDDIVFSLHEDKQQQLWVGTQHGLALFNRSTEKFTRVSKIHGKVTGIVEDPNGTLWIAAEGEGLFERKTDGSFILHKHDAADPNSLASPTVSSLLLDNAGRLWIGTRDGGVDMLEPGGKRFIHHRHDPNDPRSLANDKVGGLASDREGNLWLASYGGGGLSVLDQKTGYFRQYRHQANDPRSLGSDVLTCLFVDRSGALWVGTDGAGVQQYDPASDRFISFLHDPVDPGSLSQNTVRTIYQDVQGQIWVGTYMGGANLLRRAHSAFGYFTHGTTDPASLANASVGSFLEDSDGHIWVGTEGGWLHRFEPSTGKFVRYLFPSTVQGGSAILAIHQDHAGRIWVGTYSGGLGKFNPAKGTFDVFKHREGDSRSIANDNVWAIAEDNDGALWIGTDAGLDKFDPDFGGVTAHFQMPDPAKLNNTGIRSLLYDRRGNLWVGTLSGLNRMRRGEGVNGDPFIHYGHDSSDAHTLSDDAIVSLHEDRSGQIWVGTLGGGLNHLEDAEAGVFTAYKDFPSNAIYGIQEESSGRLWVSTNRGLARFDPNTSGIEIFDLTNGLQSLQFHICASASTRSGRLLFGSTEGFYYFDPDQIKPDTYAPPVIITALHRVLGEARRDEASISTVPEVTVYQSDKIFSLEFAALDYTLPRRNRYRYLMQGFTDKWIDLGGKREVTFTNLDPGAYVFKVQATNSDGVWNEVSTATLRVVVRPSFWSSWWFRSLVLLCIGALLFLAHRFVVRRLLQNIQRERGEGEEMARAVAERERQLKEATVAADAAHRAKTEFLTNMSHEIRTPMNGVLGMTEMALDTELTSEQREYLEMIRVSADTLLNVINDIVDFSKIEAGKLDIDAIPFKLRDSLADTMKPLAIRAHEKRLELTCDVRPDVPDDLLADPTRIRQVLVNLVNNAIKFTEEGEINVEVKLDSREKEAAQLHFIVRDTGIGISGEKQKSIIEMLSHGNGMPGKHFLGNGLGLTISARLVEMMGGKMWLDSQAARGSRFHFTTCVAIDQAAIAPEVPATIQLLGMRALVFVENLTSRRLLGEMLEQFGMEAVLVANERKAISVLEDMRARDLSFPLVVVDAHMTDLDGFAFIEQIKRRWDFSKTAFVVLAWAGQRGDALKCRQLGVGAYLTKPVSQKQLLDAILNTMSAHSHAMPPSHLVTRHTLLEGQRKMRVLLVEDNAVNQKLVVRLIEKQGHTVFVAENGCEALAILGRQSFDVVLMDIQMPEMNGFEATAAIRKKEMGTGIHLPIVAMTAHAMKGDRERCLAAGMDGYVSKPIRGQQLFDEIDACLRVGKTL